MEAKDGFFLCACFGEGLRVTYWPDDKEFYVSMWAYRQTGKPAWSHRLRHIWRIIRHGEPWEDEIVLHQDEVEKLSAFLLEQLQRQDFEVPIEKPERSQDQTEGGRDVLRRRRD